MRLLVTVTTVWLYFYSQSPLMIVLICITDTVTCLLVTCLQYRPRERLLFTGGEDNLVNLWSADTGQIVHRIHDHQKFVWDLNHNHTHLATGGGDGRALLYDLRTLQPTEAFNDAHQGCCWSVKLHDLFPWCLLTAGDEDKCSSLWDRRSGARVMSLASHPANMPGVMTIGGEVETVVTVGVDAVVRVWDLRTGALVHEYKKLHKEKVWNAHIGSHGVSTASFDGTACLLKVR
eukprot:TRINITY_DN3822_c0_g1_i2.p1 TRINITY_DN3822_c0_g1~~TRINITY_DN3822_c0_g1_i2.p1  ORF type:complete len:233 (+),score=47.39 TRINITY_DN3822_c0_g1_i2:688-1386(+)